MTTRHDFLHEMSSVKAAMALQYDRIASRSKLDPGTAGDASEEVWADFLREWLPAGFEVVTKGRVLSADGTVSPQVDVLVLDSWYPRALRNTKYYMSAGVVAAVECKLTLRGTDIRHAFARAAALKRLWNVVEGTPRDELQLPVVCGVLAHSYSRKRGAAPNVEPIINAVARHQGVGCSHPRELLDLICVADTATLVMSKDIAVRPHSTPDEDEILNELGATEALSVGMLYEDAHVERGRLYNRKSDSLAAFFFHLINMLAFERESLRVYAEYLSGVAFWMGIGRFSVTTLPLSDAVIERLRVTGFDQFKWSKWSAHI